jgi:hypothetical protein
MSFVRKMEGLRKVRISILSHRVLKLLYAYDILRNYQDNFLSLACRTFRGGANLLSTVLGFANSVRTVFLIAPAALAITRSTSAVSPLPSIASLQD